MDASFELVLERVVEMPHLKRVDPTATWGGIEHPQGPSYWEWGEHTKLMKRPWPAHIRTRLQTALDLKTLGYYEIVGHGLRMLESECNGIAVNWGGRELVTLVREQLLGSGSWAMVFDLHSDQIDRVFECDVDDAVKHLRENFRWDDHREGFIAVYRKR